jgi:hypothetical protein
MPGRHRDSAPSSAKRPRPVIIGTYGGNVEGRFEDAWERLDDQERSLLLEQRDTHPVPPSVATILIKLRLVLEPQPGLFPAPVHWPAGFRDFVADKAAVIGEDPECE